MVKEQAVSDYIFRWDLLSDATALADTVIHTFFPAGGIDLAGRSGMGVAVGCPEGRTGGRW